MNTGLVDVPDGKKDFAPQKQSNFLFWTWHGTFQRMAQPLYCSSRHLKQRMEAVQTCVYTTVRPKDVSEVQTGKRLYLPCLLACSLTPFSSWLYQSAEAVSTVSHSTAISSASYVRWPCFSFPLSSQTYSPCFTSCRTAFLSLTCTSCPCW